MSDSEGVSRVTREEGAPGGWRKALPKFFLGRTPSKEQRLKEYGLESGDDKVLTDMEASPLMSDTLDTKKYLKCVMFRDVTICTKKYR